MNNSKYIEWILRIAVAGEFFGHGMLAYGLKADWIKWVSQMTGADAATASQFIYYVGISDILVALIVLLYPIRIVILWAVFWGFWTALVRPLVGVGWLDFIERWANWGAPLALLLMYGWPQTLREWFRK